MHIYLYDIIALHNGDIIASFARVDEVIFQHHPEGAWDLTHVQLLHLFLNLDLLVVLDTPQR